MSSNADARALRDAIVTGAGLLALSKLVIRVLLPDTMADKQTIDDIATYAAPIVGSSIVLAWNAIDRRSRRNDERKALSDEVRRLQALILNPAVFPEDCQKLRLRLSEMLTEQALKKKQ